MLRTAEVKKNYATYNVETWTRDYFGPETKQDDQSSRGEFEDMPSRKMLWYEIQDLVVYQIPLNPSLSDEAKGRILTPVIIEQLGDLAEQMRRRRPDDSFTTGLRADLQLLLGRLHEKLKTELQSFENDRKERWEKKKLDAVLLVAVAVVAAVILSLLHLSKQCADRKWFTNDAVCWVCEGEALKLKGPAILNI